MTGRSWTRGVAPPGEKQKYKCEHFAECGDYVSYAQFPPPRFKNCNEHYLPMKFPVVEGHG